MLRGELASLPSRCVVRGFFGLGAHAADGAVVAGLRVHELIDGGERNAVGRSHAEDFHGFDTDLGSAEGAAAKFSVVGEGEFAVGLLALGGSEGVEQGSQFRSRRLVAE